MDCRFCWHAHANSNTHTARCTNSDNNAVQTVGRLWDARRHVGHVRAWPHSFFFSCLSRKGHFWSTSSLKVEICNLHGADFLSQSRWEDSWLRIVITPRCCQGIPSVFWTEHQTGLTLTIRWAEEDSLLQPGWFDYLNCLVSGFCLISQ